MKLKLTGLLVLLVCNSLSGQRGKNSIEINPYIRNDWYPEFSYSVGPIDTHRLTMRGSSWGIGGAYKIPISNSFFLKIGTGFYKHSFNRLDSYTRRFGKSSVRRIHYPSDLFIPFYTDKYGYNCIVAKIGAEKTFNLKKDWQIVAAANMDNYFTYSQSYHITYNNPNNPINNPYKLNKTRFFGFSANLSASVQKHIGRVKIGPALIIPVLDVWKQDEVFPQEDNPTSRQKWFRGVGGGITCNYSLR